MNKYLITFLTALLLFGCSYDDGNNSNCIEAVGNLITNYRVSTSDQPRTLLLAVEISDNGSRFDQITDGDGNILTNFTYDQNGRLANITADIDRTYGGVEGSFDYSYEYSGNQITRLIKEWQIDGETFLETLDYEYNGNVIIANDPTFPADIFRQRIELDAEGLVQKIELYSKTDNPAFYDYYLELFNYDESGTLVSHSSGLSKYDSTTGNVIPLNETIRYVYFYNEEITNPLQEASSRLYLNFWLGREPYLNGLFIENFAVQFHDKFPTEWAVVLNEGVNNALEFKESNLMLFCNGLPANSIYSNGSRYVEFNYE